MIDLTFSPDTMDQMQTVVATWASQRFPHATMGSMMRHLLKEYEELDKAILPENVAEESADMLLILLHIADTGGFSLSAAAARKFNVLLTRKWQAPDAQGVSEHVRTPTEGDLRPCGCGPGQSCFVCVVQGPGPEPYKPTAVIPQARSLQAGDIVCDKYAGADIGEVTRPLAEIILRRTGNRVIYTQERLRLLRPITTTDAEPQAIIAVGETPAQAGAAALKTILGDNAETTAIEFFPQGVEVPENGWVAQYDVGLARVVVLGRYVPGGSVVFQVIQDPEPAPAPATTPSEKPNKSK